jgi:hypothetical protein
MNDLGLKCLWWSENVKRRRKLVSAETKNKGLSCPALLFDTGPVKRG